jgi:hypothetical protein
MQVRDVRPQLLSMMILCTLGTGCPEPSSPRESADIGQIGDRGYLDEGVVEVDRGMADRDSGQEVLVNPDDLAPSFANVHRHILVPGCAVMGCHDHETASGGLSLESAEDAFLALLSETPSNRIAAENGWLLVRPGDPTRSFLIRKLEGPGIGEGMAMPSPAQQLDPAWLELIKRWIHEGAIDLKEPANTVHVSTPLFVARETRELTFRDPVRACITCHPTHVREWRISNHAYAAVDPVFHAMVRLGQQQTGGRLGQFCVQCHTPPGLALGETPVRETPDGFIQDFSRLSEAAKQGVSCDVCHTVTSINEPRNARMVYTPDGTMRSTIRDPKPTAAHLSEYSPLHAKSELCGSCHNVTNPAGALIEETFDEWASSPMAATKTCQTCHMPEYTGPAAVDGPTRQVHRHTFVGVDVSLLPEDEFPGYEELRSLTREMLQQAAEMTVETRPLANSIAIRVKNLAGHSLPSGATAERQMWLEVLAHNMDRELVFESGTLDENKDLRDENPEHTTAPGSDPHLTVWRQVMYGAMDKVEFPWQAKRVANHLISSGQTVKVGYQLDGLEPGHYTVRVRLLFRTFPPYFLRKLEAMAALSPDVKERVPTVEMAQATVTLNIARNDAAPVGSTCPSGTVADCDARCRPAAWLGDGRCDDGRLDQFGGANFFCDVLQFDAGDCEDQAGAEACVEGELRDCDGICWNAQWLGDGWCDNGEYFEWGSANYQCVAFGWDNGDCPDPDAPPAERPAEGEDLTEDGCLIGFIRDCAQRCMPMEWLGDDDCDDGTNEAIGHPDFHCEEYGFDQGDCP